MRRLLAVCAISNMIIASSFQGRVGAVNKESVHFVCIYLLPKKRSTTVLLSQFADFVCFVCLFVCFNNKPYLHVFVVLVHLTSSCGETLTHNRWRVGCYIDYFRL